MKLLIKSVVIAFCFIVTSSIKAETSGYKEILSQAHQAFNTKNYQSAYTLYEQSNQMKPLESTLYNMAVCQFKLKNWQQALALFNQLTETDLIKYNIAVSYKKLGNIDLALVHFEDVYLTSEQEKLSQLAYQQIKLLKPDRKTAMPSSNLSWQGSLNIGYGTDNNVLIPTEETYTDASDNYIETLANISLVSNSKNLWFIDLTYFSSQYSEAEDYDVSLLSLTAKKYFTLAAQDSVRYHVSASYDQLKLSGNPYLSNQKLALGAEFEISDKSDLDIELQLKNISEDNSAYYYLAGNSQKFIANYTYKVNNGNWKLGFRYDIDNKNDRQVLSDEGNTFTSYSASRSNVLLDRYWQIEQWHISLGVDYRTSQYKDANTYIDGTSLKRNDNRLNFSADVEYLITPNLSLLAEINKVNNSSNINNYDYGQQTILIGASYSF
ncbi:CDC27 family protein [Catenovulum maritimum]|uniref:Tetratricopeptide repeat protein n=1 Tax=Catenovulum maritimum TaxID=1513271 RepID=A0A0J8GT98_9ALTE|nr:tetratricopeptide repeat protein [Catenovulum maritimum]KMT65982.1 hypothetical protein XM47_05875 [Catenovulum maritimum]